MGPKSAPTHRTGSLRINLTPDIALQYRASLVFCRYSYVITHLNSADRVSEVSRGRAGKHDSGRGRHACVDCK